METSIDSITLIDYKVLERRDYDADLRKQGRIIFRLGEKISLLRSIENGKRILELEVFEDLFCVGVYEDEESQMSDFEKYDGYLSRGGQIHILPGCNDAEIMPPREEPRDF